MKTMLVVGLLIVGLFSSCYISRSEEHIAPISTLSTEGSNEPLKNLGEICNTNENCTTGFCIHCPLDTKVVIQLDEYPRSYNLRGNENFVTKSSKYSYCAHSSSLSSWCAGTWNSKEYRIRPKSEYNGYPPLFHELTKEGLDKWKTLVLDNISEEYFNEHIEVYEIEQMIYDDILRMQINYKFTYNWASTDEREFIDIKRKVNGTWEWLSDEEIFSSLREFKIESNVVKLTYYEIPSIILKEEAISKLKECHKDMEIYQEKHDYNKTFQALGMAKEGAHRCDLNPDATYTVHLGAVNLENGEITCESYQSPCAVYAPSDGGE